MVRPGDEVLEELQQANVRVTKTVGELKVKMALDPSFVPRAHEAAASQEQRPEVASIQWAAIACSKDMFDDQFGAQYSSIISGVFGNNVRCPAGPRNSASFSEAASLTNMFTASVRPPCWKDPPVEAD